MSVPLKHEYLSSLCNELSVRWPQNRIINIVCHGHSVPAGFACTPFIDTFNSYPHLVHKTLKQRFPFAELNVIVTAIGGENSASGCKRFRDDVLCMKPDLVTIDYALNDRGMSLEEAKSNWSRMIEEALVRNIPVILLTPSWDWDYYTKTENWNLLGKHAEQIRSLADYYSIGLADSYNAFDKFVKNGGDLQNLLSHVNHPSPLGHRLIADEICSWFVAR